MLQRPMPTGAGGGRAGVLEDLADGCKGNDLDEAGDLAEVDPEGQVEDDPLLVAALVVAGEALDGALSQVRPSVVVTATRHVGRTCRWRGSRPARGRALW
ncbi:hypothetical protein GCM10023194_14690 [Planotetraspora phitsanulokensis]|uniref:Uncharacterized protein n=1 Tax=Planotetraspora phitsanulokensis TaxID=575192 RepID=A0A8J3U5J5_9ACTN|nr:hypothetical protein Pph01_39220 [Planotetraspora phitsanulokensis]